MSKQNSNDLSCIEIETATPVTTSIIWLHGLGADGNDFVPFVSELNLPIVAGIRFIFPHAPMQPVTINNGYIMRAWYDIHGIGEAAKIDFLGIEKSLTQITQIIDQEIARGIPAHKIFLAGFSQGAVIALTCGLSFHSSLAGIIALSGYLPFTHQTLVIKHHPSIFLAHGLQDAVVPYRFGEAAYTLLHENKLPVTWKTYPMGHTVSLEEINDIKNWLTGKI